MAGTPHPRRVDEIRSHFIDRLNHALLRPGMFGGLHVLGLFLDDLAWIDSRDDVARTLDAWGAWSPAGVGGVLARMFGGKPSGHDAAGALVYADLAATWGYLRPQRALTPAQYQALRGSARQWTAAADRTPADVTEAFGPPSVGSPSYNPRYPVSFAYASPSPADPLIAFDFWQDTDWAARPPEPRLGPEPVLRNVRWREGYFQAGFTFTPTGHTLLVEQPG